MQPLILTLKGFRGIRDGLGLDVLTLDFERLVDGASLVAIAGANGRGKTTVMDCATPFLTMPSRAAAAGPGGFSFYDHVYLPENEKDLTWAHEGRSYRSQVVIRLNGRRRTEAFLFVLGDAGRWAPFQLDDGTLSDGKVDTYTRCVEALLGSADTFFTSVFSAQGKRQLCTYRNGEIKTLLADLLGQEEIRALGQKATDTARLLKAGLGTVKQELSGVDGDAAQLVAGRTRLAAGAGRVAQCLATQQATAQTLETARAAHARWVAQRDHSRSTEARRSQLGSERRALIEGSTRTTAALALRMQGERERLVRLEQRVAQRRLQERSQREALSSRRQQCLRTLANRATVERAVRRQPWAEGVLSSREHRVATCRARLHDLSQCQGAEQIARNRLASIEREAGRAAIQAEELARRFGLTGEVPCTGTDLQGRCKLLADAREAQALVPSATALIRRLALDKQEAQRALDELVRQRGALTNAPEALAWAERRCERARERVAGLAVWVAQRDVMAQADAALTTIERELAVLGSAAGGTSAETTDERAERQQIAAAEQVIAGQIEQEALQHRASLLRLDEAVAALPAPFDQSALDAAAAAVSRATQALGVAEKSHLEAMRDAHALEALEQRAVEVAKRRADLVARVGGIEAALGRWNLFARCMSNDGLIALAIDDAGPALSGLANDLLLACYGARFTVEIRTLVETGAGGQREGFDILVHDGQTGESKSIGWMSGGERAWIEMCLTRAIALYLAQHAGRRYTTLFSDEVDGALDPERKRMFMAMKREVLRLGGYEREFFISQTPELTAMADAVIDLDEWQTEGCSTLP